VFDTNVTDTLDITSSLALALALENSKQEKERVAGLNVSWPVVHLPQQ
jgi:hypothetical protein